MKQKIVIRVQMNCKRCRSKAMKTAVGKNGIEAVSIEGDDKDRLVVIGEGVDSVALARSLRKKLRCAEILTVEEAKEKKKKEDKKPDVALLLPPYCVICEPDPSFCSIL